MNINAIKETVLGDKGEQCQLKNWGGSWQIDFSVKGIIC